MTPEEIIEKLELIPLSVEGGFFRETYRSSIEVQGKSGRVCGTCIYYLLRGNEISRWHKVDSDEIWLYHAGSPAVQMLIHPDGRFEKRNIGGDINSGCFPQSLIPADTWQAALLKDPTPGSWGLFGAIVFPGFEYSGFTASTGRGLASSFPDAVPMMEQLGLYDI